MKLVTCPWNRKIRNGISARRSKAIWKRSGSIIYLDDLAEPAADHTLIAYDPRNRGRSDATTDGDGESCIGRDVEDLESAPSSTLDT